MDFLKHWMSLRAEAPAPTSEAFLENSSPRFAAHAFILEAQDDRLIVRLQGTGLEQARGRDITGDDFFPGRSQRFRSAAVANLKAVLAHPCGLLARSSYGTTMGRAPRSDWIFPPLAVRATCAARIVGAVFQDPAAHRFAEVGVRHFRMHKLAWLDIGRGIPADPPLLPVD